MRHFIVLLSSTLVGGAAVLFTAEALGWIGVLGNNVVVHASTGVIIPFVAAAIGSAIALLFSRAARWVRPRQLADLAARVAELEARSAATAAAQAAVPRAPAKLQG